MKDNGTVDVKEEFKGVEIPQELVEKVREAQSMCPATAVVIEE